MVIAAAIITTLSVGNFAIILQGPQETIINFFCCGVNASDRGKRLEQW